MKKNFFSVLALVVLIFLPSLSVSAAPFYEGKTIRIIVGYSAGGGYDTYARVISRHIGKYIPGHPTILVENMTGAGSLIAANHVYKVAKPDGLTIGHFNGGLFFSQLVEQPGIIFDARKFEFIGAAGKEEVVYAFTAKSGITSMDKLMSATTPVKMGGVAPGAFAPDNVIRLIKAALNLPIQLVSGYKGTADVRIACESGELAGSSWGWDSMRATWRKSLDTGIVVAVLQAVPKPFADLPKVPLAINYAKTDEARQLIEVGIHSPSIFARPFVLPPGVPKEQITALRLAFQQTMKDKEFLAETQKAKLDLDPVTGDELLNAVNKIFILKPPMIAKLKDILFK